jgi:hypothetical protein
VSLGAAAGGILVKTEETKVKKGVVYVAFGYEYLLMAANSARTVRASNPGIVCELVTNLPYEQGEPGSAYRFDRVTRIDLETLRNRSIKTRILDYTDLEYGVFLDCDTEVRGRLDPMFRSLQTYDVALKMCWRPPRKVYEVAPGISSVDFPEWNSGVIFFRKNDRTYSFFDTWNRVFEEEGKNRDQPALARTVFECGSTVRLLSMNARWNAFPNDAKCFQRGPEQSTILHYRKPEGNPEVAPGILSAHRKIGPLLAAQNPELLGEIEETGRRYAFLATSLYRRAVAFHPKAGRAMRRGAALLMRMGVIAPFALDRISVSSGASYVEAPGSVEPQASAPADIGHSNAGKA